MMPKVLFTLVNLVCIATAAFFAVDSLYGYLTANLNMRPAEVEQQTHLEDQGQIRVQPVSAYKAVIDRNLFGTRNDAAQTPAKAEVDVASLEETKLNLKLWGTVSGSAAGDYAVIEDVKAREQNLYRVGDAIQTATVKEIFREKVVLTVAGKDEVLQMQELEAGKGGAARPGGLPSRSASAAPSSNVRTQRISLRRSYIDKAMTDVASLMTQVQIQPHMENGMAAGLSLSSIKPNSIFRRMGLRNGDVITGVDGSEISTVDDALRLVENLKSSSSISVQLKRRGREKNIEYRIR